MPEEVGAPHGARAQVGDEELRLLVERVRDYGLLRLDPEGRVASWNVGAELIHGYSADEIIGQHFRVFYPPEDIAAKKPERELQVALETGRYEEDGWRVRKDGSRFWANAVVTPLYDEQGKLRGFAKITRDLSAKRSAEEARRKLEAEQQARRLAEHAFDRVERLQRLTSALASALTPKQVGEAVVSQSLGFLEAFAAAVFAPSRENDALVLLAAQGYPDSVAVPTAPIPLTTRLPIVDAYLRAEPLFFGSVEAVRSEYPGYARIIPSGGQNAVMAVPLLLNGRARGVLGMSFRAVRHFSEEDRSFIQAFAQQCAQALDRAQLVAALEEERSRLSAVLQQMPSALAIVDARGKTILSNKQNEVIFRTGGPGRVEGIEAYAQFKGLRPNGQPMSPDEWPLARSLRTGEIIRGEVIQIIRGDGEHGFIRINSAPVRDESGKVVAGVVTYDDITEQRRAEDSLRFLERASTELASSLDYAQTLRKVATLAVPGLADWTAVDMLRPDGLVERLAVAHVDPEKVKLATEYHQKYDVLSPTSAPRKVIDSGKPLVVEDVPEPLVRASARSEEHYRDTMALGLRSGIVVPIITSRGAVGALTFAAGEHGHRFTQKDLPFCQELAARAALAIENATLYAEAQDAIQKRDDFLSVASHELKTPLTSLDLNIATFMRLTEQGRLETVPKEKLHHRLKAIERQSQRLRELVEDLLDVSRISAGKLELHKEKVDLGALLEEVAQRFSEQAQRSGCPLELEAHPVEGYWDRGRVDQVITNLLSNAVKYGSGKPVQARVVREEDFAVIEVTDQGIGIAPKDHTRIFERFERAASPRSFGGIGLGLWITTQIVEAHGGTISVDSEMGQGSTFTVRLPLGSG